MNFKFGIFFFFLITTISCSRRTSLADELACSKFQSLGDTEIKQDFHKNFKIDIPINWKHKGYFDDYQSSLFAADTIKQLTETYILDIAYKNGELSINDSFSVQLNKNNSYEVLKSNIEKFKDYTSYWQVSKGEKNGYSYHIFNLFIQTSKQGYIEIKSSNEKTFFSFPLWRDQKDFNFQFPVVQAHKVVVGIERIQKMPINVKKITVYEYNNYIRTLKDQKNV